MAEEVTVPTLRTDVDMTRVSLSVDDMFVVSRVDGRSSVPEIATIIGKSLEETESVLRSLESKGVITLSGASKRASQPPPPLKTSAKVNGLEIPDSFIFPVALMQEDCDLDVPTRKKVIWVFENLETWTHYELLQVDRRADKIEIKKAYFERSKEWHPDRFRQKRQGSFKRMVETIFKALTEAQKVLGDKSRRLEYDQTVVFEPSDQEMKEIMWEAGREEREARRQRDKKARRKKKNPVLKRKAQAKSHFENAKKLREAGKLVESRRAAQMAVTFDEKNKEYTDFLEVVTTEGADIRIQPLLKVARHREAMLHWDEAITILTEAVRVAPENGTARLRLAYNLMMGRRDVNEVMREAQKAVTYAPEEAEGHYILGRCCEEKEMAKNAKKHYEMALELRPGYQEVKMRLSRLKWGL